MKCIICQKNNATTGVNSVKTEDHCVECAREERYKIVKEVLLKSEPLMTKEEMERTKRNFTNPRPFSKGR